MLKCLPASGLVSICLMLANVNPVQANPTLPEIKKQQEELRKNVQNDPISQSLVEELQVENAEENQQVSGGISFVLTGVTISGNQILTKAELEPLIKPLINNNITGDGLKRLSSLISLKLAEKGYRSSRAFIPPQEIKNGLVEIKIEEDKLASIHVLGKDSFKYNEALFYQYFSDLKGKIIHTPTLIERLKYLNFLPGTRIKPTLKKIEFGQSALVLVLEPVQDTTAIAINNNASKFQGDLRTVFSTLVTNPTGRSDTFNFFAAINPEFPKYFSSVVADYAVPLGDRGGKIRLYYSEMDYQIDPKALGKSLEIGAGADLLLYSGGGQTVGLEFEKPFWLDIGLNSWSIGIEKRHAKSSIVNNFPTAEAGNIYGFESLNQSEDIYGLNFGAQFVISDQWLDDSLPAQNVIRVKFTKIMEGFLGGLTQEEIDFKQANEESDNVNLIQSTGPVGDTRNATANFWKLYLNYLRRQTLPWNLNLHFQLNAEYANFDNIPGSYDYGGADSGTSGGDWSLSLNRTFPFDRYIDWLSLEMGYEQQFAYNVYFPSRVFPFRESTSACGGKKDLIVYEEYQCKASSPYLSLRAKSDQHILWLKYKAELEEFGLTDKKATLSYTYLF